MKIRSLARARSRLPHSVRIGLEWLVTVGAAAGLVLAFQAEVAKPYRIPTASMEPTLHCARPVEGCRATFSDRVLANRLAYRVRDPRRGDIVVFETPSAAATLCGSGGVFVKRIIGLPGDVVEMKAGYVFVDGRPLDERAYVETRAQRGTDSGRWEVPRGAYFLLGDNRTESCDSRTFGSVPRGDLIGPVAARYWPPSRIGEAR